MRQAKKLEQTQAQKYLKKRLEQITKSASSSEQIDSDSDDDDDSSHYLARYIDNPRTTSRKQDELTRYLKFDHREINTTDILDFWKSLADTLPGLAKVACQILTVPATSAGVERSFSAAGQIVSERRSNISPDVVNDTLFLRSMKKTK